MNLAIGLISIAEAVIGLLWQSYDLGSIFVWAYTTVLGFWLKGNE